MKIFLGLLLIFAAIVIGVSRRSVTNHLFHPGYGACGKCQRTWDIVEGHDTPYGASYWTVTTPDGKKHEVTVIGGSSCFPLCKECWEKLTPEKRLPYYRAMFDHKDWGWDEKDWPAVKASVLAGN